MTGLAVSSFVISGPKRIPELTEEYLAEVRRTLRGRYEVERPLGRGGMGIVFLARDVRLARPVAIKILPPERAASPVHRERFLREARIAARLSHPHIVPIFSVGEVAELVFFVMAYVPGYTLGHRVRIRGALPPAQTVRVLREVALALAHAHDQGVVHRDVKPDNILIDRSTGSAFVTDFGIARFGAGPISGSRTVVGTPEFMSPEQARGLALDPRSDLYSLGVVGFYAASGRLPFDGVDPYVVMAQHVTDPPPAVATVAPKLPPHVATLIDRCLAKRPEERPIDGARVAETLTPPVEVHASTPLAVRAFVAQGRQWAGLATLYSVAIGFAGLPFALAVLLKLHGPARIAILSAAWVLVVPPLLVAVSRARKLLRSGHGREDLVHALTMEHTRRVEELAFRFGGAGGGTRIERVMRGLCYGFLSLAGALTAALAARATPPTLEVAAGLAAALAGSLVLAIMARLQTEERRDHSGARKVRWWSGTPGEWIFRIASWGLDTEPSGAESFAEITT